MSHPGGHWHLPVYLLAGGRARRFGANKARAPWRGRPLLSWVAESLEADPGRCVVVGHFEGEYADLGFPTVADAVPDHGPLGGLHAALEHAAAHGHSGVLVAPCDTLGVRRAWLRPLEEAVLAGAPAAAFRAARWDPLFAAYHVSLRSEVARRLTEGPRALHALLDAAPAQAFAPPEGWAQLVRCDTPASLR